MVRCFYGGLLFCGLLACNETPPPAQSPSPPVTSSSAPVVAPAPLILHYTSPNHKIIISDGTLTHYQKEEHFAPNATSATPGMTTTNTLADKHPLEANQLIALQEVLSNGFMELDKGYGAPTNERHYPYFINVRFQGKSKEVIFRSNPSFDPAPAAFQAVEKALLDLSERIRE
ncbi:MAG: hypothetical protein AAGD05_00555 [Bacteroidota bacterium]